MTKKIAYALDLGPGKDAGRVILVEEGTQGYRYVADYDSSRPKRRPGIVQRLNQRLGVSREDANRLVAQSMRGGG